MKTTENISELLVKDFWYRRINNDALEVPPPTNAVGYREIQFCDGIRRRALTNDDFINELTPTAHTINAKYWSTRPIRELKEREVETTDDNGNTIKKTIKEWVLIGYDDMETVRLGLQKRFALSKASFFGANGFNICNETTDTKRFERLSSWKDVAGLDVAFLELAQCVFQTGDAAIYLYSVGNTIEFKIFSSLYGDKLYPSFDEQHRPVVAREYTLNGRRAVDVFRTSAIQTWVQGDVAKEDGDNIIKSWWSKIRNWFKGADFAESADGWRRVRNDDAQITSELNACVYFRIDDVVWGVAQDDIEGMERAMSYIAEECKNMAFPDMFVKATKIESMPPIGAHGRTWGVHGNADDIKVAEVKAIEKPDMSNIATVDLKNRYDSIMRATLSVFVDPELVKSSDISGTGIKILYGPEIQYAQNMWTQFYPQLKYMLEVFKHLVAKVEGDGAYATMLTSVWQEIYLPEDEQAKVKMELDKLYAKAQSRKATMSNLGNQHLGDYEQIVKEWEEELRLKSRIPAEEKALIELRYGEPTETIEVEEENNPTKPKIDNNSDGKTVLND